jgi:hypothetical protein
MPNWLRAAAKIAEAQGTKRIEALHRAAGGYASGPRNICEAWQPIRQDNSLTCTKQSANVTGGATMQPKVVFCRAHGPWSFCYVQGDGSHVNGSACLCHGAIHAAGCPVDVHRNAAAGDRATRLGRVPLQPRRLYAPRPRGRTLRRGKAG